MPLAHTRARTQASSLDCFSQLSNLISISPGLSLGQPAALRTPVFCGCGVILLGPLEGSTVIEKSGAEYLHAVDTAALVSLLTLLAA